MADIALLSSYVIGIARIVVWVSGTIALARSVAWPSKHEHLRWYDRVIRGIGVFILVTLLFVGIPRWLGWIK